MIDLFFLRQVCKRWYRLMMHEGDPDRARGRFFYMLGRECEEFHMQSDREETA